MLNELSTLEQTITGLPQAASAIGTAASTTVTDVQRAVAGTGRAIAQGNFTAALGIAVSTARDLEHVFNDTLAQVQTPLTRKNNGQIE